jgi:hypothetical protein
MPPWALAALVAVFIRVQPAAVELRHGVEDHRSGPHSSSSAAPLFALWPCVFDDLLGLPEYFCGPDRHVSGISWYLRSLADADAHRGSYSTVTRSVHAQCVIGWSRSW